MTAEGGNGEGDGTATWAFASDRPVPDTTGDRLSRAGFAARLAGTLARRSDPSSLVVALYGKWGEGKTSVLHFVRSELDQEDGVVVVTFNPWRFTGQDALTVAFFQALASGLQRDLKKGRERIGEWIEKYGAALVPSIKVGEVEVGAGGAVAGLGQILSAVSLEEARERLAEILREEGKRVVVIIDDLDRLDRDELHAMFKLVKQSADFDYVSYLLAFDDEVVAGAIGQRYGGGGAPAGFEFLEKIVQVPLRLPPADLAALRHLCLDGVQEALHASGIEVSQRDMQEFQAEYQMGLEPRLATPRIAKHYGNALLFSLPLLRDEVNVVDLMLIEGVRIFYPTLYRAILDDPSVYLGEFAAGDPRFGDAKERRAQAFAAALEGLTDREQAAATHLIKKLFPRSREFMENMSFGDGFGDIWTREKRICSRRYFARYFTYSILESDVADKEVEAFCDSLEGASGEEVAASMRQIITTRNAENVIEKLRYREEALSEGASRSLAEGLAHSAEILPNPEAMFSWFTPFSQAAILAGRLLRNIPDEDREAFITGVLDSASVDFAIEVLQSLGRNQEDPPLPDEGVDRVGRSVAERIERLHRDDPAKLIEEEAARRLTVWSKHLSREAISDLVRPLVEDDPGIAVGLLRSFTPTAYGTGHPGPFKSNFDSSNYDHLGRCMDPAMLFDAIIRRYGEEVGAEYERSGESTDERIVNQFAFLHRRAVSGDGDEEGDEGEPAAAAE